MATATSGIYADMLVQGTICQILEAMCEVSSASSWSTTEDSCLLEVPHRAPTSTIQTPSHALALSPTIPSARTTTITRSTATTAPVTVLFRVPSVPRLSCCDDRRTRTRLWRAMILFKWPDVVFVYFALTIEYGIGSLAMSRPKGRPTLQGVDRY